MKNTKQNEKDMGRTRRENEEKYKSNAGVILHTNAKSTDVIDMITAVL